jgi:hypothetical protein
MRRERSSPTFLISRSHALYSPRFSRQIRRRGGTTPVLMQALILAGGEGARTAGHFVKEKAVPLFILAVLAIVAYLPALTQPFISDDYPNIALALEYGPISGWEALANDGVSRPRAMTFIYSYAVYQLGGMRPEAFYSANILLHILNCWLLFAAGRWQAIGYRVSFWAAAFFAVYEGHQEAIMWFSACNELLMFLFGLLSFIFWLIFLERETAALRWLALSFFFFLLTLLSKESAVIFVALFALPLFFPKSRLRRAPYLLPHILICVPYVIAILMTRSYSFRFSDQSFVLSAPFWLTWSNSYGRMLWFWGLAATISIFWWSRSARSLIDLRERAYGQPFLLSFIWMGIGFIPYMFVDYMHSIPSRQTYLASAGLAWLMGAAIVAMRERYAKSYKWAPPIILLIMLSHNVAYLWTKKHQQFLERAQPTEQLLSLARSVDGPIFIKCFPANIGRLHAETALKLILNKPADTLIWDEEEARRRPPAATFCYE